MVTMVCRGTSFHGVDRGRCLAPEHRDPRSSGTYARRATLRGTAARGFDSRQLHSQAPRSASIRSAACCERSSFASTLSSTVIHQVTVCVLARPQPPRSAGHSVSSLGGALHCARFGSWLRGGSWRGLPWCWLAFSQAPRHPRVPGTGWLRRFAPGARGRPGSPRVPARPGRRPTPRHDPCPSVNDGLGPVTPPASLLLSASPATSTPVPGSNTLT